MRIDLDVMRRETATLLNGFVAWWPHRGTTPAFSGGLLDSWPSLAVDAFGIMTSELDRVSAYLAGEMESSDG